MRLSLTLLIALLVSGCASGGAPQPAGPKCPCLRDTHEQLQGALWMQTAAEYRVLAEATYRAAGRAVRDALANPAWTAATEQTSDPSHLPPAVILDLDDTVLDNSLFQGEQVLRREPYARPLWTEWVKLARAALVPGAAEFLKEVRDQGIAVFFVTNRTLEEEPFTLRNLTARGIQATAEEILSNKENGWSSDKTARRQHLAQSYRILLLIGDDLGDFIPAKLTPEKRVQAAETHLDWWGTRWFLLPNPMYGSWDRALYEDDSTLSDEEVLRRKMKRVQGFQN
jgi:5'-nucleotidase (lipoprotein e(P4) family)